MGKFTSNSKYTSRKDSGLIRTTGKTEPTYEGGTGYAREAKSALFLLAVNNMVKEKTFYESAETRDSRYIELLEYVIHEDPAWVARFIPWLRRVAGMRTASIVAAATYGRILGNMDADYRHDLYSRGVPTRRSVVDSALARADEPAEYYAYRVAGQGNLTIAGGEQRGLQDAIRRLYNEHSALKWNGNGKGLWKMGSLIQLTHTKPGNTHQSKLFSYLVDKGYSGNKTIVPSGLSVIKANRKLWSIPPEERRDYFEFYSSRYTQQMLKSAGITHESLSSWLGAPLDSVAWEAVLPSMGLFAAVRNLRRIDEADVPDYAVQHIIRMLEDPETVEKSMMFPLRFYTAYREISNSRWAYPLEKALNHSLWNTPELPGRTLVLIDQSGSMHASISAKSSILRCEISALFGLAIGKRAQSADIYTYGRARENVQITIPKGGSLLPLVKRYGTANLGGTETWTTLRDKYNRHDRVVVVTDEQTFDSPTNLPSVPIVTFNVAGYKTAHVDSSSNRITVGGLSDVGFHLIKAMDSRAKNEWPF